MRFDMQLLKAVLMMSVINFAVAIENVLFKKMLDDGVNRMVATTYRLIIGTLFLTPFAICLERKNRPQLTGNILCLIFLSSLLGTSLGQYFFLIGLQYTSSTFALAFSNMVPVVTFVLALFLRQETVNIKNIVGKAKVIERSTSMWVVKTKFNILSITYAGVALGLCCVGMSWCLQQRGPVFTSSFIPLIQVFASILSFSFFHEQIYWGRVSRGDHWTLYSFMGQKQGGIERSQTIALELIRAIRESRISIVVLSKNYASSSWCLNELVEILECKNIVMPIFYQVDPSDVRKQTGDFGTAFKKSCKGKTEEEKQRWSQALIDVGNIAGEHFGIGKNEARMIEKIAKDISDKLNATTSSRDFDALANETTWFGHGSRIIVTTEDKELLKQHDIDNIYHVDFPSREEALEIFCKYAFKQSSPPDELIELSKRVTELCGNLPLGLSVVGSSLLRKKEDEWETVMRRLETSLDRDIEDVLRVGYDSLHEEDQALFLHIAVFFNYKDRHLVIAMLADCSNLNVRHGLTILENKSLIQISTSDHIVMVHKLLQQVGRRVIQRQEPWKRCILIDPKEICDALKSDTDTRIVSGMSFDISRIREVSLSETPFKMMCDLRFLSVSKIGYENHDRVHIPENMEFPPRLSVACSRSYGMELSPLRI
ncbi:hypothetical protein AALP_AA6G346600 [Arabis alpina]|uniref:ADP-ribosyl cyclase/cyclic ADP-ribose hydrolase n=1 Tax=Arabis alpina TaxID=50452 RepID=A0A087GTM3_ARAAL|nr:hypothetical protein AALP_AA6G346600 [Arabis alpina]